ncbi:MAG: undecaprenyl/decaprenyl-phosphate alpha-N-acetylglucosaminyl 1-phosphate transferase, partial [Candidatus Chloroheliales bacterium]
MSYALQYLLIFSVALGGAMLATPGAKWVAHRLGVVDTPNARKIHLSPIPLLGGLAIYAGFIAAVAIGGNLGRSAENYSPWQAVGILIGATVVALFGMWDDKYGLRPRVKLVGQVLGALALIATGVRVEFLHNDILDYALTIFWVVGICNAINLMDNMNGLAGGVSAVASLCFFALAALNDQALVAPLSIALFGACIGFLRYNFGHTASIFMGDTGSLFLGFMLATVGIKVRFPNAHVDDHVTWLIPIIVLAVPIFDTTLVTISRLRRRISPATPGQDHFSHRLVRLGMSRREAVMFIYLIAVLLGVAALVIYAATSTL